MINLEKEILKSVEEFKNDFGKYYSVLLEYINSFLMKDGKYQITHPELNYYANRLQVSFIKLPDIVQVRLLDMEFEVFLHCQNVVDFYSFRDFLIHNNRFQYIATIVERVDSELDLIMMIIKDDAWRNYSKLPKRNFDFYRSGKKEIGIMEELKYEYEQENQKEEMTNEQTVVNIEKNFVNTNKDEKKFFDKVAEGLEKADHQANQVNKWLKTAAEMKRYISMLF